MNNVASQRIGIVKPPIRLLHKCMQLKPITAIIVLLLLSASLLVSGCTSSNNNNQAASSASQAGSTTAKATASVSASASARPSVTPSPTPSSTPSVTPSPTPSSTPSPTPSPQPVTGSFDQSTYVVANGTVVTATVSNWQSNPSVAIGSPAHGSTIPMQSLGNGRYTLTLEGVIILRVPSSSGTGIMTLVDNGKQVATAATIWRNP